MAKKRTTFPVAAVLTILPSVIAPLIGDASAGDLSLEAHVGAVRGKNLVLVDLKLVNKGNGTIFFISPIKQGYITEPTGRRPIITRQLSFNVMLNGKPLDEWRVKGANWFSGHPVDAFDFPPGKEWKAAAFLNWQFPLSEPGEYSARVVFSLTTYNAEYPHGEELTAQSDTFSFTLQPFDRDTLNNVNLEQLTVVEKKTPEDEEAVMAALSVAFSEEPAAVNRLAEILGKKKEYLPTLTRDALKISLERLSDRKAAVFCAERLLQNSSSDLRLLGVYVMRRIGSRADVPALVRLLDDEDYNVRWFTCEALEKLGGFKFDLPEHCENQLELMVAQSKKWWSENGGRTL
jgi:hypothetical protein